MHSELFTIGSVTIYSYGLMMALGMICAVVVSMARAKKRGLDDDALFNMGLLAILAGVVASKLLYWLVNIKAIIADPSLLLDLSNGFVFYGGVICGVLVAYLYCRKKKMDFVQYADCAIPTVALAQGIGRIGCFLAGCCYGKETDGILGIVFPAGSLAPSGVALYPTQLFMAIGNFLLAAFLFWYTRQNKKQASQPGMALIWYMILHATGRFIIEFFRGDERGAFLFFSTSQWISLGLLIAAVILVFVLRDRAKKRAKAEAEAKVAAEFSDLHADIVDEDAIE